MTVVTVIGVLAFLDVSLMLSGYRILVGERLTSETIVESTRWSEGLTSPMRECSYFTGRSVLVSRVNADQLDECPVLFKPYAKAGI